MILTPIDRLLRYGLGVSLVFGGAVGFGAADMLFQKIISVLLFFGAVAFCAVILVQAAAEDARRPIAEDVRRVKIKEPGWMRKYYDGEFDPEDDTSSVSSADSIKEALGENRKRFSKVALNPQASSLISPSRGSRGAEASAVKIRRHYPEFCVNSKTVI